MNVNVNSVKDKIVDGMQGPLSLNITNKQLFLQKSKSLQTNDKALKLLIP